MPAIGLKPKPSVEDICIELKRHRGRLYWTSKALGCTSTYVRYMIKTNEDVQAAYMDSRDELTDEAEHVIYNRLVEGSESAAKFVLSTLGKDRGYVERTEITGKGGGAINVTLNLGRKEINFEDEIAPPEGLESLEQDDNERLLDPYEVDNYESDNE